MSIQSLLPLEERLVYDFCNIVGSDYCRALASLLESRNHLAVVTLPMPDPSAYVSAKDFALDYQAWTLLRKADFLETGVDRAGAALTSFLDAEKNCLILNQNGGFSPFVPDRHANPHLIDSDLSQAFGAVIHTAEAKIRKVLGKFDWDKVHKRFGFSGGATTRLSRRCGSPFYKLQGKPEVTRGAALLSVCVLELERGWKKGRNLDLMNYESWVTIQKGSHATTVPKNAKTDRFICKEPCMNMYIQRGFGGYIRSKLKGVGVDLDDQTHNQRLALEGSVDGSLATVDLKAASDSISLSLVQQLLPSDWFEAMCMVRSEYTLLKDKDFPNLKGSLGGSGLNTGSGHWHRLEKISSMGNGYTFELESLIFWALTESVVELSKVPDTRIGVYGDDIICSSLCADRLIEVLAYCGFTTNHEKTFVDGPFRESCGLHAFKGRDVTPFAIDEVIAGQNRVHWFLNSLNLWLGRLELQDDCWLRYIRKYSRLLCKREGLVALPHVPASAGLEAGIMMPLHLARTFYSFKRSGFRFAELSPRRAKHRLSGVFGVLYGLMGRPDGAPSWEDFLFGEDVSYENVEVGDAKYMFYRKHTSMWGDPKIAFGATVRGFFFAVT